MTTLNDTVKKILTEGNADTLKPGSAHKDPMPTLSDKKDVIPSTEKEDLGKAVTKSSDSLPDNTKKTKKDTSKSSKSSVGAEPMKHLAKEETEANEDDVVVEDTNDDEIITEDDINEFVAKLQEDGLSEEEIQEAVNSVMEDYEEINEDEETDGDVVENEEDDVNPEDFEAPIEVDLTEDMKALFEGETLSEEFQEKAKLIFETVIKSKLVEHQALLDELFKTNLVEAIEQVENTLTELVEKYIDYVTEQWVIDNEVAIESGLRTELTEDFISGFRNLCLEHHIDIPEEKIDVVEELSQKIVELENKLNEQIESNVELNSAINESIKEIVFNEVTEGLTDTQVEKLKELSETVEFVSDEDFGSKITVLRENYFPTKSIKNNKAVESDSSDNSGVLNEEIDPRMQKYVKAIGSSLPN